MPSRHLKPHNKVPAVITPVKASSASKDKNAEPGHYQPKPDTQELSFSFCNLLSISNLVGLAGLRKLQLDNNRITKIETLEHLTNLTWLDLSYNRITRIEGLSNISGLRDLSLTNNCIEVVENLQTLTNLQVLCLGGNNIKQLSGISSLRPLRELRCLTLNGSPIAAEARYRQYVLAWLPWLSRLDYRRVQDGEADKAAELFQGDMTEVLGLEQRQREQQLAAKQAAEHRQVFEQLHMQSILSLTQQLVVNPDNTLVDAIEECERQAAQETAEQTDTGGGHFSAESAAVHAEEGALEIAEQTATGAESAAAESGQGVPAETSSESVKEASEEIDEQTHPGADVGASTSAQPDTSAAAYSACVSAGVDQNNSSDVSAADSARNDPLESVLKDTVPQETTGAIAQQSADATSADAQAVDSTEGALGTPAGAPAGPSAQDTVPEEQSASRLQHTEASTRDNAIANLDGHSAAQMAPKTADGSITARSKTSAGLSRGYGTAFRAPGALLGDPRALEGPLDRALWLKQLLDLPEVQAQRHMLQAGVFSSLKDLKALMLTVTSHHGDEVAEWKHAAEQLVHDVDERAQEALKAYHTLKRSVETSKPSADNAQLSALLESHLQGIEQLEGQLLSLESSMQDLLTDSCQQLFPALMDMHDGDWQELQGWLFQITELVNGFSEAIYSAARAPLTTEPLPLGGPVGGPLGAPPKIADGSKTPQTGATSRVATAAAAESNGSKHAVVAGAESTNNLAAQQLDGNGKSDENGNENGNAVNITDVTPEQAGKKLLAAAALLQLYLQQLLQQLEVQLRATLMKVVESVIANEKRWVDMLLRGRGAQLVMMVADERRNVQSELNAIVFADEQQ